MDSLFSILSDKNFDEPPEIAAIKKYVQDAYKVAVGVQVRDRDILVLVPNAALAGSLRMKGPDMQRRCQLNKKVVFRIG